MVRILVADDSPEVRLALAAMLEDAGHFVYEAVDGREAVRRAAATVPDIIFMDLNMPRMDGMAALAELKANPHTALVPVVMISSTDLPEAISSALRAGAAAYVKKPWDEGTVEAHLQSILYGRRLQRERPHALPAAA